VALLSLALAVMLALAIGGALVAGRLLALPRGDRIMLIFTGSQKSVAVGAPLATILFAPDIAGMVIIPILVYHLMQLVVSAWIAPAFWRQSDMRTVLVE
jgi:sodium/bile acid cotransporter 7